MIPNQWYAILESKKLKTKPVGIKRLGEELVAWRNTVGAVVLQADRCVHKGASLSLGTIRDGCLECPYHGLRFESSGVCSRVPFMDKDYKVPKNWRVKTFAAREEGGLIWMWYGDQAAAGDPPWFEQLPRGSGRSWETSGDWPYNYTRLMDSNFDIYHFPFVHRSINPGLGPVIVEQEVEDLGTLIKVSATLDDFADERRGTRARKTFVMHVQMPCLLYFEMTKKIVLLASMTPIDDERTWVFARYYVNMPMGGLMAWLFGAFEYKMVQNQDKRIMDTLPKGPLQHGEYNYGKADAGSILWQKKRRKLIEAAAAEAAAQPEPTA